jgi:hypothetical protein
MKNDARQLAATAALLAPEAAHIGPFTVRKFSGGDMLLGRAIGLKLASGDDALVRSMTPAQQTDELLQIGALLCHSPEALKLALWKSVDAIRADFIAPVLFELSADQTADLIGHVTTFFARAAAVDFEVEKKPDAAEPGDSPRGK